MRKVAKTNVKEKIKKILRKVVLAICASALICLVLFGVHAYRSGAFQKKISDYQSAWNNWLVGRGFYISGEGDIFISGRDRTDLDSVRKALAIPENGLITQLDLKDMHSRLRKLPWVKKASIKRQLPNVLYVILEERKPIALFKDKNNYYPIDEDGMIVHTKEDGNVEELIVIVGKGSVSQAPTLVKELEKYPQIKERVMGAKLIGERRWQLFIDDLENGVVVDLPDVPLSEGLARLYTANNQNGILDKQAKRIDLRLNDRAVIVPLTSDSILRPLSSGKEKKK